MEMTEVSPKDNTAYRPDYVDYSSDVSIKNLGWLTCPVSVSEEDEELPAISVFADPEATEELELVVHSNGEGQAQVAGQRFVSLKSQGSDRPSVASFTDIRIKRAGMYVFEVRAVRNTEISLVADHATTIEPRISTHSNTTDVTLPEELGLGKIQTWGV
ncbi:hypothetical protein RvY_01983 [Ramazzottius varieornatus]|uniref:Uncharacterized protein n=1 Tax=Ramazzottius varieornatus TaxID=947166 RepID=A0A1D1UI76_RAMVA|nr:hypothetical protein RvY_01983 [Ramazzottius varieornatus]